MTSSIKRFQSIEEYRSAETTFQRQKAIKIALFTIGMLGSFAAAIGTYAIFATYAPHVHKAVPAVIMSFFFALPFAIMESIPADDFTHEEAHKDEMGNRCFETLLQSEHIDDKSYRFFFQALKNTQKRFDPVSLKKVVALPRTQSLIPKKEREATRSWGTVYINMS